MRDQLTLLTDEELVDELKRRVAAAEQLQEGAMQRTSSRVDKVLSFTVNGFGLIAVLMFLGSSFFPGEVKLAVWYYPLLLISVVVIFVGPEMLKKRKRKKAALFMAEHYPKEHQLLTSTRAL